METLQRRMDKARANRQVWPMTMPTSKDHLRPMVIIVVLTVNQREATLRCLRSVQQASYANYRVILVDNGSQDDTAEAATALMADLIVIRHERNRGCAGGRNSALRVAGERFDYAYALTLDNDAVMDPRCLSEMVQALEADPTAQLASCKIYGFEDGRWLECAGETTVNFVTGAIHVVGAGQPDRGQFDAPREVEAFGTTCLLIQRCAIEAAGGFDEGFDPYGFSDLDLCFRLRKQGFRIRYVPSAVLYHQDSRTPGGGRYNTTYAALKGRNLRRFLRLHAAWWQQALFWAVFGPLGALRTLAREVGRGNTRAALSLISGFLGGRPKRPA